MQDLKGKNVIVTGASRGIGRQIAMEMAGAGASLIIVSRKQEALEALKGQLEGKGARVHAIAANMGKMEDVRNLVSKAFDAAGTIDVLVNNAATNPVFFPLVAFEEKAWDKIMEVNLKGPFFLSIEVARRMIEKKSGVIVNIASTAGMRSWVGLGVYGISKAGLIQMTRQMAREWAAAGVRVNAVAPGLVATDFSKVLIETDVMRVEALKTVAMNRHATVDEIAGVVLFLASDASRYITGQTIIVDGGQLLPEGVAAVG
jgi:dehydrogenase/reductase SDR family protein 4